MDNNTITTQTNTAAATEVTPAVVEPKENMIPKHRFDEVYGQMKTLQEQLAAIEAEKAAAAAKELEETNQFKTLYEKQKAEYEALQATAGTYKTGLSEYETVVNKLVETKLANVPAELHDLIPANLTVTEKLDWINKAESKGLFGAKQTTNVPIGQPMNVPTAAPDYNKMSAGELLTMAYSIKK